MPPEKKDTAIIVFTKFPVEGKVKTRLAKNMGNKFAVSFYRVCAEHTFKELLKVKERGSELFLFCSEENEIEKVMKWAGNNFNYYSQQGNDLGLKMYNSFDTVFKKGYKKVIIIGTDAPDVSINLVQSAISVLDNYSVVIGPANDGGYYLLGFKSKLIDLFSGISDAPWVVAEQLLNRTTLQVEFLRLADHVNHLAEVYARVPNPEWFWRRLALRFNSCWPNQKDLPPRRFTQEQVAVRTEVAAQVWHIMEGVRPAADGSLEPLPEVSHSKEMLQLIQRSFWTREMSVRGSLICGRLQARQEPVPDMGNWFPDEAISGGVNRFLRLLTDVVRHIADVNSGNDLTLIQPYARPNSWDNSWVLGPRDW
ncbi:MAG: TIGR04282 family arsenosugar biosynthesis glycosyltransferase, partial [Bacteroidetes bacterium]|nr:TIGR04282 family arsenosugar biosynthesis glycosyltransferase [Bacteroidota bacterium]